MQKVSPGTPVYYLGRRAWVLDNSTGDTASLRVIDPPFSSEHHQSEDIKTTWDQVEGKNERLDKPAMDVIANANENKSKRPNIRALSEEFAEAILAERGKHEHPLRLELVQIAGVCINMIRQIDAGDPFKP